MRVTRRLLGACLTPVLTGEPNQRDEVQTGEERDAKNQMTICCSPAPSPVLILGL
ncbi:hypothetical protein [Streptomyces sp. NPDC087856]|uniref:hypothetical protein n=1 Tax=Streptomyces sp. NPDC087856 TaxID=3365811 RepID=UPI0038234519